ncbi:transmembrane ascorbate ferrireductase 1-like [Pyrus x bretschneideri]|uniref:transmembrane ascorbate ferrireductase 1-like n=1 Tax=Pyrus x bretschneideri TaxID=225117 RepID=UPI0005112885|nr:transmembrane ascorbate ferrireductase 1-like [Pyrus x bretschneideri]
MALKVPAVAFTSVVHTLGIAALVLVLVWTIHFRGGLAWEATNKNLIFNLHPVLMLLGLIILGGEALVSYKSLPFNKKMKKVIHLVLHALALALGIIGIYLAFKNHNESGIANMYSSHAWIGIGVIVLYGIQWIYGFVTFFFPGGSPTLRRESIPWHVVFGIIVYVLAVGDASLGFLEKLTFLERSGLDKFGTEAFLVNFTTIITVLFGVFVILSVISEAPPPVEDYYSYSSIR